MPEKIVFAKNKLQTFEPNQMHREVYEAYYDFSFPCNAFSSEEERREESAISKLYDKNAITIIVYSSCYPDQIIAVSRIIQKNYAKELLPIEYSKVTAIIDASPKAKEWLTIGEPFVIAKHFSEMPVCEIGALRIADFDPTRGVTNRERFNGLYLVTCAIEAEIYRRGLKTLFLTCSPNLAPLFRNKFYFSEVAEVSYNGEKKWKALWRRPHRVYSAL